MTDDTGPLGAKDGLTRRHVLACAAGTLSLALVGCGDGQGGESGPSVSEGRDGGTDGSADASSSADGWGPDGNGPDGNGVDAQEAEAGAIDTGDRPWRPLHLRTEEMAGKAVDLPEYYASAPYGGEGLQNAHCFVRAGARTWFGGDMCGLRYTEDDQKWINPRARGLRACTFHAIAADPDDGDRIIVVAATGSFRIEPSCGDLGAVYLSTDLAHSFTKPSLTASNGNEVSLTLPTRITKSTSPLCHLFATPGYDTPATRRWRMIEFANGTARLWKSDTGGESWYQGDALPSALSSAEVYQLIPHPKAATTMFAVTSAGIWKTTDDGVAWARIGNAANKLNGSCRGLWIDPETPNKMLASQQSGTPGVFYTTNGGASGADWAQVLDATGGAISPTGFAVGPKWSEGGNSYRTIYVMNDAKDVGHKSAWIQHWNVAGAPSAAKRSTPQLPSNTTPPKGQWYLPVVEALSQESAHWRQLSGGGNSTFAPDPNDPKRVCAFGYGLPWFSIDGGTSFRPGAGYGGMNSQAMSVDLTLPDSIAVGLNDIGITMSLGDAPTTFAMANFGSRYQEALALYSATTFGATAVVILPDSAQLASNKRGRVILFGGDYSSHQTVLVRQQDGAWEFWKDLNGNKITSVQPLYRAFVGKDPNRVFSGTASSTDAGDRWNRDGLNGKLCCGASSQNDGVIFGTVANGTQVWRSADHGGNWAPWVSGINTGGRGTCFWLNPADDTIAISRSSDGDLCLIRNGTVTLNLNLIAQYAGAISLPLIVSSVGWCPTNPRRITAFAKTFGLPQIWEGLFNSDFSAIAWKDITRNFPCTSNTRDLIVHPLTGERIASCGQGVWVLPPDGDIHENAWYLRLPEPFISSKFSELG